MRSGLYLTEFQKNLFFVHRSSASFFLSLFVLVTDELADKCPAVLHLKLTQSLINEGHNWEVSSWAS